jgi:transcriptional regulator with XRE-family HTH domain
MANKKKVNGMSRYTTYYYGDHDPVLDLVDDVRKKAKLSATKIAAKTRITTGTLHNWETRKTKRPLLSTVAAVFVACGVDSIPITPEARRRFKENLK